MRDSFRAGCVSGCCLVALLLASVQSLSGVPASGGVNEDQELLRTLATMGRENKDKIRTWQGEVTLTASVVNKPLAASEFTLESLGVKPGTRVSNTMLHTTYRYEGTADRSASSSDEREERRGEPSR